MGEPVSVSREVSASPERVYALVADLVRMGDWSPENEGGTWLGDGPTGRPGARFRGRNRHGRHSWTSLATVVDADPGRRFSFRVTVGPVPISHWNYTFETVADGCRVTESWVDLRPRWFRPIGDLRTGVGDRPTHNRQGMEQTLERLGAAAESDAR